MSEPIIAAKEPVRVYGLAGKAYYWCSCGKSWNQPFCDGSHKGTGFTPVTYVAKEDGEIFFCACKHSKTGPVCDKTHKTL